MRTFLGFLVLSLLAVVGFALDCSSNRVLPVSEVEKSAIRGMGCTTTQSPLPCKSDIAGGGSITCATTACVQGSNFLYYCPSGNIDIVPVKGAFLQKCAQVDNGGGGLSGCTENTMIACQITSQCDTSAWCGYYAPSPSTTYGCATGAYLFPNTFPSNAATGDACSGNPVKLPLPDPVEVPFGEAIDKMSFSSDVQSPLSALADSNGLRFEPFAP